MQQNRPSRGDDFAGNFDFGSYRSIDAINFPVVVFFRVLRTTPVECRSKTKMPFQQLRLFTTGLSGIVLLLGVGCTTFPQQTPRDPFVTVEPGLAPRMNARPEYVAPQLSPPALQSPTVQPPPRRPAPTPTPINPYPPTPQRGTPKTFADPVPNTNGNKARQPDPFQTDKLPIPKESPQRDGPQLSLPEADAAPAKNTIRKTAAGESVDLQIEVPKRRPVGSGAPFHLTIKNVGEQTLRNVSVVCEFDEALTFPGSERKSVTHKIPKIEAGDAKESLLTLVSETAGLHECRFTVQIGSQQLLHRSATVEFVSRQLDWQVHGPTERTVGSRAEFNIPLINVTDHDLRDLTVRIDFDAALTVREMTQGGKLTDRSVTWTIDKLTPNEGMLLQLEVECREPTSQACLLATVSGTDLPADDAEACLSVKPVTGLLDVRVQDVIDPIAVDGKAELTVTLRNRGLQAARDIVVSCVWPAGFEFVNATRTVRGQTIPVKFTVDGKTAALGAINRLDPDETIELHITLIANRPGAHQLAVQVTESATSGAVEVREPIMVHR